MKCRAPAPAHLPGPQATTLNITLYSRWERFRKCEKGVLCIVVACSWWPYVVGVHVLYLGRSSGCFESAYGHGSQDVACWQMTKKDLKARSNKTPDHTPLSPCG